MMALAAIVEVPLVLVLLTVDLIWGAGPATFGGAVVLFLIGSTIVSGAVTFAVGQEYLTGEVGVSCSLRKAWWRVLTLVGLAVVLSGALVFLPLLVLSFGQLLLGWLAILVVIPAVIGLAVYWFVAAQAVVVENLKPLSGLRKSYQLVQGIWLRVFGFAIVLALVSLGLGILVSAPFTLSSWVLGSATDSILNIVLLFTSQLAVRIAVLPVISIAGTLLYYDLRVRKEQYTISKLTQEMGIAPAG